MSLDSTSVWGCKKYGLLKETIGFSEVSGAGGPGELAEIELRLDLSMGRKINEIPKENDGFWGSVGLRNQAESQKLSLDYNS